MAAETPWYERIRARRQELQGIAPGSFTRAEVARRVGITERTLWAWETGQNRPQARKARRLAKVLGLSLHDLGLEPPPPMPTPAAEQVAQPHASVALAVIVHNGRALMTRRRWREGPFQWNFVSGEIETGETPEQAAVREVLEEVGLNVEVERRIGDRVQPISNRHMVYLICRIPDGADLAELVDHEENAEVRWCTRDEVNERLASLAEVPGGLFPPLFEYLDRVLITTKPN